MSTLIVEIDAARAQDVRVSEDELTVELTDGRTLSVPLVWFPRLLHGTPRERNHWRFIGGGLGIHWPDLDEDISVEGLLLGKKSGEGQGSLQRWLDERRTRSTKNRRGSKSAATNGGTTSTGKRKGSAVPKRRPVKALAASRRSGKERKS